MHIFDSDSPMMVTLRYIGRLMALSLCTVLCCVPVFTAGAAVSALYSVCFQEMEGKGGYAILADFFTAFKQNFKQGLLLELMLAAIGFILVYSFYFQQANGVSRPMAVLLFAGAAYMLLMLFYVFPLQARYDNPVMLTLRNALVLALVKLPVSLALIVLSLFPVLIIYLNERLFLALSFIWVFLGIAVIGRLKARLLLKLFKKLDAGAAPESAGQN